MPKTKPALKQQWWKEAVVYQIYPRSFQDSNNDGQGDIQGIISRLDYIKNLGVDVIWLNPVYKSPNEDGGYDVSDYYDIMEDFGTMADFDELLAGIHSRGMKLIMDVVLNHTSAAHPWFVESRKSKNNKYRDYYIWAPPDNGKEPNNWLSYFGGPAWELDPQTGEYYLHIYARRQPDVNWDNKNLRQDFYKMMNWWMDKGIDGFRVDAINSISKKPGLPSAPEKDKYNLDVIYSDGPRLHEFLKEMRAETYGKRDMFAVGETPGATPETTLQYAAPESNEFDMVFHFDILKIDFGTKGRFDRREWTWAELKSILNTWQTELYGKTWYAMCLGNHDFARMVSRFGNDKEYHDQSAKLLATMLLTHYGTPYIFQGDELGMTNMQYKSMKEVQDIDSVNSFTYFAKDGGTEAEFIKKVNTQGRDHARTPMQWDSTANGGFSKGKPWMDVNPNFKRINVAAAEKQPNSILHFYRQLIAMRKKHPMFIYGDYQQLHSETQLYVYKRTLGKDTSIVVLNPSNNPYTATIPELELTNLDLLMGNYSSINTKQLEPWEARVYRLP